MRAWPVATAKVEEIRNMVQVRGGVEEEEEPYMWMMEAGGEGKRGERKRRFSEEQVKSLESMFESQTKLEPRKKLQLAEELGLHPRQVAIWFQNKRARWKSKQLEREYDTLRADYDALLSSFDSLKTEKQLLTNQLEKLAEMLEKPAEGGRRKDIGPGNGGGEEERTPSLSSNDKSEARIVGCDDDEEKMCAEVGGDPVLDGSSLVSAEQQFGFQPSWPSDQPCSGSQWWEFWPMNE